VTLDLMSLPLALLAGVLGILSPCVWSLVPVVMSSAASSGRAGQISLALGLSAAFAMAGSLLTYVLLNLGLDPLVFRKVAALLLIAAGVVLVVKPLGEWVTLRLSMLTSRMKVNSGTSASYGQFATGALLGLVWLPCIGPTLGAAIALASMGQDMAMAFVVMFVFGMGTALALIAAAALSSALLMRMRPGLLAGATQGKLVLGWLMLLLGVAVLSGLDKYLESWALTVLPDWALGI